MITDDQLATAAIAKLFGSELKHVGETALDGRMVGNIVDPRTFLVPTGTKPNAAREAEMMRHLQAQAEAACPLPPEAVAPPPLPPEIPFTPASEQIKIVAANTPPPLPPILPQEAERIASALESIAKSLETLTSCPPKKKSYYKPKKTASLTTS